jgi:hypothetical protein
MPPDVTQALQNKGVAAPTGSNSVLPDLSNLKSLVPNIPDWLRSGTSGGGAGPPKQ